MTGLQSDLTTACFSDQQYLHVGRDQATSSASLFGVAPSSDLNGRPTAHFGYGLYSTTSIDNGFGWLKHAPNVRNSQHMSSEKLRYSRFTLKCEYRNSVDMEEVNAEWLRKRLDGNRGLQAELSRHTGISPDKISKILNGNRLVQAAEIPLFVSFFSQGDDNQMVELQPEEAEMLDLWRRLDPAARDFLRKSAAAQLSEQDQNKAQSP